MRKFSKEDVDRMRGEMWSQFAPDTTLDDLERDRRDELRQRLQERHERERELFDRLAE